MTIFLKYCNSMHQSKATKDDLISLSAVGFLTKVYAIVFLRQINLFVYVMYTGYPNNFEWRLWAIIDKFPA